VVRLGHPDPATTPELPGPDDGTRADGGQPAAGAAGVWVGERGEVAADLADGELTPATLAVAGLAAAELRTDPAVAGVDARHRLHAAIREIDALCPADGRAGCRRPRFGLSPKIVSRGRAPRLSLASYRRRPGRRDRDRPVATG